MTEFWNHILQMSFQPQQLSMMVCHCKRKCSTQKCGCKSRKLAYTNLCLCNNEGQNDDDVHADDDINSPFLRRQYSVLWWTLNYDLNNISNCLLVVPHPIVVVWLSRPFFRCTVQYLISYGIRLMAAILDFIMAVIQKCLGLYHHFPWPPKCRDSHQIHHHISLSRRIIDKIALWWRPFRISKMAAKKFSMKMETLVSEFSRVISFKKCEWLQISTNTERKYIAHLTNEVSVSTSWSRDGLETWFLLSRSRLGLASNKISNISVSSRSRALKVSFTS